LGFYLETDMSPGGAWSVAKR